MPIGFELEVCCDIAHRIEMFGDVAVERRISDRISRIAKTDGEKPADPTRALHGAAPIHAPKIGHRGFISEIPNYLDLRIPC